MKHLALEHPGRGVKPEVIPLCSWFLCIFLGNLLPRMCQICLFLLHRSSLTASHNTCQKMPVEWINDLSPLKCLWPTPVTSPCFLSAVLFAQRQPCQNPQEGPEPSFLSSCRAGGQREERVEGEPGDWAHTGVAASKAKRKVWLQGAFLQEGLCVLGGMYLCVRGHRTGEAADKRIFTY